MTEKEFKKYEDCSTTGEIDGYDLDGGIVVGYDFKGDWMPILVKAKSGRVHPGCEDYINFSNPTYKKEFESGKCTYLWCDIENLVINDQKSINKQKDLDLSEILKGCEGI